MIDTEILFARLDDLATFSESPDYLCRRYLTSEHRRCNDTVAQWMRDAGMTVREDAAANIIGHYPGRRADAPIVLIGSHLDTVRDAGQFDGMLGVLGPIAVIDLLNKANEHLDFAIEIVGFGDEEGVRFQSTLLGSRAVAGRFDFSLLERCDDQGVSLRDAYRDFGLDAQKLAEAACTPEQLLCYLEMHIEQGPVLEANNLAVGTVTAIAGASRFAITVRGRAGHAGTVPMRLRQDAVVAAASMVGFIDTYCRERDNLVGTVGQFVAQPGAVNVIAGEVVFSLDVRSGDEDARLRAVTDISTELKALATHHQVEIEINQTHDNGSCQCAPWLMQAIDTAIAACGHTPMRLPSGAGHDAMAFDGIAPIGMLFVRCEGGVSHHPDENMTREDAAHACDVLLSLLRNLSVPEQERIQ